MNYHHQLIILFIGGFCGWSLFVYTLLIYYISFFFLGLLNKVKLQFNGMTKNL